MRTRDSDVGGHGPQAATIRWIQVALFGAVVLLVGFRIWERHHGGASSSITFGLMGAAALSIGALEHHRSNAARRSR
ncbi:hypothetical protein [Streptomyces sp. VRA16 Mangrove soil]|uniref:hypothetical protein n=1 Tax=Streptomyces sp. VRA16 Mangrove soil TaxID=2817434 RepID=UPI001A9F7496|nr:hypothetical protein [Streptomyces sp. VRA16 Mangrove soil]MBO1331403.1 hypothetical protein [Streptomyces sp. VRA16 Mangrove soil]